MVSPTPSFNTRPNSRQKVAYFPFCAPSSPVADPPAGPHLLRAAGAMARCLALLQDFRDTLSGRSLESPRAHETQVDRHQLLGVVHDKTRRT